jgi:hypothetical protein
MTENDATHDGDETDSYEPQFSTTIRHSQYVDDLDERADFTRMHDGLDRAVEFADQGSYRLAAKALQREKRNLDRLADSLLAEYHHDE